jgi:hypothetical protein
MKHGQHLDSFCFRVIEVHDTIAAKDNFAHVLLTDLRHYAPRQWEGFPAGRPTPIDDVSQPQHNRVHSGQGSRRVLPGLPLPGVSRLLLPRRNLRFESAPDFLVGDRLSAASLIEALLDLTEEQ